MSNVRGAENISADGDIQTRMVNIIAHNPLLALRPSPEETLATEFGNNPVVFAQVIEVIGNDGEFIDHGEQPIFWSYVRRQLNTQCDSEFPWICGRIEKGHRAYRLMPPSPAEVEAADKCIAMFKLSEMAVESSEEPNDEMVTE